MPHSRVALLFHHRTVCERLAKEGDVDGVTASDVTNASLPELVGGTLRAVTIGAILAFKLHVDASWTEIGRRWRSQWPGTV
jgi:hypothetical protein